MEIVDKLLRVNLSSGAMESAALPEAYRLLGGRSLTSRIVSDEVDPLSDPLGPRNKLVWAPGLLSGTTLSSSSRISVGGKSPLTGGIKEANAGGETGIYLAQAGYRAVVVEGEAAAWQVLVIEADGSARLEDAPAETMGAGTSAIAASLFARYGQQAALAICGPAGEQGMLIAGVTNTDKERRASRLNARGGLGAVMGAKRLRALVVRGNLRRAPANAEPERWKDAAKAYVKALREHPSTARFYPDIGTAGVLELVNKLGGLPTRNFAAGQFEGAAKISGARMRELILERGGEGMTTHACMTGCAIRCSNVFADAQGKEIASSMEFETHGLFGSNLGIDDFDAIAHFTRLCNDLGVDTIETGGAIGIVMAAGLVQWGDAAAVMKLLDEDIRRGTPLGRIIGQGAGIAGKVLGVRRVPVVKNQTISAYDPRAIKGNGVTYCTTAMGADHTAGNTIAWRGDHLDPQGKVALSRTMQVASTLLDLFGFCNFARGLMETARAAFVELVNARLGSDLTWDDLERHAVELNRLEIDFNRRAGLGPATDRLPEWMTAEPLAPHNSLFDVPAEEMARIWDD